MDRMGVYIFDQLCQMHLGLCVCVQLCLTLCDPMDCSLSGSSVHGLFQARNTGTGCHSLLQGMFLNQGSSELAGRFFVTVPPGKATWDYPEANSRTTSLSHWWAKAYLAPTIVSLPPRKSWTNQQSQRKKALFRSHTDFFPGCSEEAPGKIWKINRKPSRW